MKMKINKYEFNVTNRDWILDNGSIYQCMTLRHRVYNPRVYKSDDVVTIMSKVQFKKLLKEGKLREVKNHKVNERYEGCRIWQFQVE